jgi:hypothetical protein
MMFIFHAIYTELMFIWRGAGDELLMVEFKGTSHYSSGGILEKKKQVQDSRRPGRNSNVILNGIDA